MLQRLALPPKRRSSAARIGVASVGVGDSEKSSKTEIRWMKCARGCSHHHIHIRGSHAKLGVSTFAYNGVCSSCLCSHSPTHFLLSSAPFIMIRHLLSMPQRDLSNYAFSVFQFSLKARSLYTFLCNSPHPLTLSSSYHRFSTFNLFV